MALLNPSPTAYADLRAMIEREEPDVAVLRLGKRFRYVRRLKRDFPNLVLCVEFNGSIFSESGAGVPTAGLWRREEARQTLSADCVSAVSAGHRDYLLAFDRGAKARVLCNPNGFDPEWFHPPLTADRTSARLSMGVPGGAVVLGYAGGMESWRRVPELVRAVADLRRAGRERLFLALVGSGEDLPAVEHTLEDRAADLRGSTFVTRSWVTNEQVGELAAGFDIGLLSFQAPYGCAQKLYEYRALGLPVVAPNVACVMDLVRGEEPIAAYEQNPDGLRAAIAAIYDDLPSFMKRRGIGLERLQREYTWRANAERVVRELEARRYARSARTGSCRTSKGSRP
jgi:glycosyltransferase involved in cell wall biosynthesis